MQSVLLTLTSQDERPDEEMRSQLASFLAWGRKYAGPWFSFYVIATQDQQRGVLHFHLVLAKRVPKKLMLRMRQLWAERYGMGPGSFDIKAMRSVKGTARYLSKYLGARPSQHAVGLGPDGYLTFTPWQVSRHNGEPYVRDAFRGNSYSMSDEARFFTRPSITFWGPVGAFPGLDGANGTLFFFDSPDEAAQVLDRLLNQPSGP